MPNRLERIVIGIPEAATRHARELGALARYYVRRLERELGIQHGWTIHVAIVRGGYACRIAAEDAASSFEARAEARDAALALRLAVMRIAARKSQAALQPISALAS